jgi:hypothetical protein
MLRALRETSMLNGPPSRNAKRVYDPNSSDGLLPLQSQGIHQ